ncbi:alanine racemase [Rhodoblastus sphagnicola]|uniref:Alanine racemase n=2 Tax=Rhodoblastus sphagnicola TaxID=333368 RepID=A0A2S6NDC9_9HYPH|nr:alanine racemase [Rhodoblastus sphagnicola]MBB4198001.1 alanine racemase [Rhodoblastus sphagnicola]PPQ32618.1 alanine racemase [Rhodoblastus sphagnicola]
MNQIAPIRPDAARNLPQPAALRAGIGAVLDIDLDAIAANRAKLIEVAGGLDCAAVVKADAYGLGAEAVAAALARAGCDKFFVAHIDEGIALRAAVPTASIFVLHGVVPGAEGAMCAYGLIPVLSTPAQIEIWRERAARRGKNLPAALHLDTGMARLGLSEHEFYALANDPSNLAGLDLRLVLSHLAAAEEKDNPSNARQREKFEDLRKRLPKIPASLANSSGVFLGRAYHFDLLRPGAALYGIAPRADEPNPLAQVVKLSARVLRVDDLPAKTPVGYNGRYVTPAPSRIATLSLGYADGFCRALGNSRVNAGFAGQKLPIVGNVSMDMITVDASSLPPGRLREGDFVDVIGGDADSVDRIAQAAGTIGYEILTALGARFQRRHSFSNEGRLA